MPEGFDESVSLLINIISALIAVNYMDSGFTRKNTKTTGQMMMYLWSGVYFLTVSWFNSHMVFEGLLGLSYGLILIAYGCLFLQGRFREKVIMGMLWVIIAMFSSYAVWGMARLINRKEIPEMIQSGEAYTIYVSLGAAVLKLVFSRLVLTVRKKIKGMPGQAEEWAVTLSFLMVFFLSVGLFSLELGVLSRMRRHQLSLFLLAGMLGLLTCLGYFYNKMEQHNREKQELSHSQERMKNQKEYLEGLERICREIHVVKHDMAGRLDLIRNLLLKGKNEEALQYIEQVTGAVKALLSFPVKSGNEGLDTALVKTIYECREKCIEFHYMISGNYEGIDKMDMSILLYNLLSNAAEACERIEMDKEREIYLQASGSREGISISIENTILESVLQKNPAFHTSKKDKELHGFGMDSIRSIIAKYDGTYICEEEDNRFIQEIYLKKAEDKN